MSVLVSAHVDGADGAEAAVAALARDGFPDDDINVLDSSPEPTDDSGEESAAGLAIGGVLGALGGGLAVLGALAATGGLAVPLAAALLGLASGGTAGGLLGAALGEAASARIAPAPPPSAGKRVAVHACPERLAAARAALTGAGAHDLTVA